MTNPQEAMEAARRIVAKHAAKVAKAAIEWPGAKPIEDTDAVIVARALLTPWRDMSTAPKDGTWVLLYGDGPSFMRCPFVGYWTGMGLRPDGTETPLAWYQAISSSRYPCQPTHWMPLPPAPEGPPSAESASTK
jgi:hypothetical protein